MLTRSVQIMVLGSLAAMLFQAGPASLRAQHEASTALTGQITSMEEGSMEGVLVTAKKEGSTVAVTVASDEKGRYGFPQTRLEPGRYTIRIRAIGYEVDDPWPRRDYGGKSATARSEASQDPGPDQSADRR